MANKRVNFIMKGLGFKWEEESAILPLVKFLLGHSVLNNSAFAFAYLMYLNYWANTVWIAILISVCFWNGTKKYYELIIEW